MKRNFERFEIGHYYLYIGDRPVSDEFKEIIRCHEVHSFFDASFNDIDCRYRLKDYFDDMIEVEEPHKPIEQYDVLYNPVRKKTNSGTSFWGKPNGHNGFYILKRNGGWSSKEIDSDKKVKSEVNKYKEGDVVYLRTDLKEGRRKDSAEYVNEEMEIKAKNRTPIIIKDISERDLYVYTGDDGWGYSDWMIEGLVSEIDSNTKQGNIEQEKVYIKKVDALHKNHLPTPDEMRDYPFHSKATEVKLKDEDDFVPAKITF